MSYILEEWYSAAWPYTFKPLVWTVVQRYRMQLQFRIFWLQYSFERICAAIGDISTIQCALYCKLGAKYSAHATVYTMWTVVPDMYNVVTSPHIKASVWNLKYLRCYRWYLDIEHALYCKLGAKCSAHRPVYAVWTVVPDIYNIMTTPHIQASIFNWIYLRCHWRYADIWVRVILQSWCQIQRTFSTLRYLNCGPGHIHCKYSSAYSGFNIQLNVSALILEISRQCNARYTANMVSNIAHILQFTLSELWTRPYTA
jgi:hypothetical protein